MPDFKGMVQLLADFGKKKQAPVQVSRSGGDVYKGPGNIAPSGQIGDPYETPPEAGETVPSGPSQSLSVGWRRPYGEEPPPLPVRRPMVDPVVALKKETARGYNYTPEATEKLYRTPVRYEQMSPESFPKDYMGAYWPNVIPGGQGNITVRAIPQYESHQGLLSPDPIPQYGFFDPETTMAHEFGHKWMAEDMPWDRRAEWGRKVGGERAEPWVTQADPGVPPSAKAFINRDFAKESYAEAAAQHNQAGNLAAYGFGSGGISSPEEWDRYFAGLYRDVAPSWR